MNKIEKLFSADILMFSSLQKEIYTKTPKQRKIKRKNSIETSKIQKHLVVANISITLIAKKSPVHREAGFPDVDRLQMDIATYCTTKWKIYWVV